MKQERQKRRTSPSWEELDPFGSWDDAKKLFERELLEWSKWNKMVLDERFRKALDEGEQLIPGFPMLSGTRLWRVEAASLEISAPQIGLQMRQYSGYSDPAEAARSVIRLLDGAVPSMPEGCKGILPPLYDEKVITPLVIADFALACMYLCNGHQTDALPRREGGNLQQYILNTALSSRKSGKGWRYYQKCKNSYKGRTLPPEDFWEKIDERFDTFLKENAERIRHKFQSIDKQRVAMQQSQKLVDVECQERLAAFPTCCSPHCGCRYQQKTTSS